MRVLNLIIHILAAILMVPDLIFWGINFLMGVQYLRGLELLIIPFVLMFALSFFASLIEGITLCVRYRSIRPKSYRKREILIHGICAFCFALLVIYRINVMRSDSGDIEYIVLAMDMAGFLVSLAGIIITAIGSKKAIAKTKAVQTVPLRKTCPNCGTAVSGNFCGKCGAKI